MTSFIIPIKLIPMVRPDITKAKTTLGWEPKVALREGLAHMVEDFRKRLGVTSPSAKKQKK